MTKPNAGNGPRSPGSIWETDALKGQSHHRGCSAQPVFDRPLPLPAPERYPVSSRIIIGGARSSALQELWPAARAHHPTLPPAGRRLST